ncbi:MAG: hypothetical protein J6Z43_08130 [Clostridiales bacterium]|nr:hypothetical protein [Clostridiales bacterium]
MITAAATLCCGCGVFTQESTTADTSPILIEKPYDPTAMHVEDFDILVPRDVNSYEAGSNFWTLYFFDADRNIYVDDHFELGTKAIILQVHTFSYNKIGDVFLYDVYVDGELESAANVYTNHTDKADWCEISYGGDGTGLNKGRYTIVVYDVNSTSTVCCVAYCVVK